MGCNFCSTSAMFGGKGKFVNFYETGDELFDIMSPARDGDEGPVVLRHGRELPAPPQAGPAAAGADASSTTRPGRCTCSARPTCFASYTMEQLVGLGISWVWMGLEGKDSQYTEAPRHRHLRPGPRASVATASACWARRIIGLENHTPGEHRRGDRLRRPPRHRLPPVHALHADPRHAAARRAVGRRGG